METTTPNPLLSWSEVLKGDYTSVIVQSYGYTERSSFSSHFEPFKEKRSFIFQIHRFEDGDGYLDHKWLMLEEPESSLKFELVGGGQLYLDDPDLWARPDY